MVDPAAFILLDKLRLHFGIAKSGWDEGSDAVFGFVSGHDFSRAVKDAKSIGLQPL
jgi:hypothetical protein